MTIDNFFNIKNPRFSDHLSLIIKLSIPAIVAEISSIIMQYIDAAMVGSLGADASAAIGLVTSSSWLLGGLCISVATGFSVQVAHFIGAHRKKETNEVFAQSLLVAIGFGVLLSVIGVAISTHLPVWLGGNQAICPIASKYFLIFSLALPATQFRQLGGSMLQCSGNMKAPSLLNILMCFLDVLFNFFLIFPTRQVQLIGKSITIVGAGMGVSGAALGTALSEIVVAVLMMWVACTQCDYFKIKKGISFKPQWVYYKTALNIAVPIAFEHIVLCGAQVALTHIIAPLGTVSIAANSLAVTAESFCYMPGYGIGTAATTLVGHSIGAGKKAMARRFSRLCVVFGMAFMSVTGILMYIIAPMMFAVLTPDESVRQLGVQVLRLEAFAEPLYAASIVTAGALRGAGDTKIPSLLNLLSMWGIRITLAFILAPKFGLYGVWVAMLVELCIRGILFLIRLIREKWLKNSIVHN